MSDDTEQYRRAKVADINSQVESLDKDDERIRLESEYGQVWNTDEMSNDFEVLSFAAPFVIVKRKSDQQKGSLEFQHMPRFYFNFSPAGRMY